MVIIFNMQNNVIQRRPEEILEYTRICVYYQIMNGIFLSGLLLLFALQIDCFDKSYLVHAKTEINYMSPNRTMHSYLNRELLKIMSTLWLCYKFSVNIHVCIYMMLFLIVWADMNA